MTVLVLLPLFNDENRILRALESVMKQSDVEIVLYILDNNSSDNSLSIVKNYSNYENVKIHKNDITLRPYENWLKVYALAINERFTHVCYIASDDYWGAPGYLKSMLEIFSANHGTEVVFPNFIKFSTESINPTEVYQLRADTPNSVIRRGLLLGNWTYVYLNYALFSADFFDQIMKRKFSKFSNYIGSDWWLTYEILRSTTPRYCNSATYYKDSDQNLKANELSRIRIVLYYLSFPHRHVLLEIRRFQFRDVLDFILIYIWSVIFGIIKIYLLANNYFLKLLRIRR
jgi:glycosyltransferase involved in cell wall biosynthesis